MKIRHVTVASFCALLSLAGCSNKEEKKEKEEAAASGPTVVQTAVDTLTLPAPYATESVTNESKLVGWSDGEAPKAPAGFVVTKFADNLKNPRWSYVAPNGDIFVVESDDKGKSANRITLLRDQNKDGKPDLRQVFIEDLSQPFGMLVLNNYFYVANTDGITRYPYKPGQTKLEGKGQKIMELPAGGYNHHWTRNIIASPDGTKIYVSVGSASNVGEYGMDEEKRRACILQINLDGSNEKIYASGLRNPVGMDWAPGTNVLWTSVNERDELGDDLVPDYLTSVKEGGFYGWPYSYFGKHVDPRRKGERPDLVAKAIVPEVPLGSHTSSLGLAFYDKDKFPAKYRNGAFIGQHGSWNRSELSGYKVLFVPFKNGKPSGKPEDFLTGFVEDLEEDRVHGRPAGVTVLPDGSLLVNDDKGNTLWRVSTQ
ncbi:sorbosone dehydrogenase family protein [Telluribacter sp. SYSU D00476]|uniref:PQQ-dependent sugar dehydrogenase n=1 Tax=Telluribacter sp. SYSU D00476 TaxID=2811430 RepID=UPI001FF0E21B|nr:sorbosone dehydrogenase family protein [Telluribacter sp. SYSU D00476]